MALRDGDHVAPSAGDDARRAKRRLNVLGAASLAAEAGLDRRERSPEPAQLPPPAGPAPAPALRPRLSSAVASARLGARPLAWRRVSVLSHARAGAQRYRALLALPGARAPVVLSAAGSMPIGMFGLGILLLARDATGSFAEAGRVVGAFSVANALGAVAQGRLMDRLGQTRVLRAAATGHVPALTALVIAANARAPTWVLALCALCGGATFPQVPAAMRSLWGALVEEPGQRETAYAMVSIVFEVAVVTAPALVAAIVAVSSPAGRRAGRGGARGRRLGRLHDDARLAPLARHAHEVGWLGPLGAAGMRTVFGVLVAFGTAVGIVQVAVPAFAAERGSAATGGVLLAALSAGSLLGGLVYGARSWPGALPRRLALLLIGLGAAFALLAVAGSEAALAALLVLSGLLLAPTDGRSARRCSTPSPRRGR